MHVFSNYPSVDECSPRVLLVDESEIQALGTLVQGGGQIYRRQRQPAGCAVSQEHLQCCCWSTVMAFHLAALLAFLRL